MQVIPVTAVHRGFGTTSRPRQLVGGTARCVPRSFCFLDYITWAMFQGEHYDSGPYLSPFYSPELWGNSPHAWFGTSPPFWPAFIPFSPALLILPFPAGFRFTCYYYRGAYYKAFWADPPSCAVGEPRKSYLGENSFPLIIQNIHRYSMYAAVVFLFLLSYDVWLAMWFDNPATGQKEFGIGVGTIVLLVNVVLLDQLHARLPFAASSGRRREGRDVEVAGQRGLLQLLDQLQQPASALRVVQPVLGDVRRHLHPPVLDGDLDRSEDSLMAAASRPRTYSYDVLVDRGGRRRSARRDRSRQCRRDRSA